MEKIYGYVRVSTMKQKFERQIANIKEKYADAIIVSEKWTGTTLDRPKFNRLLEEVKEGDTIVFDEVSRMARNAEEGYQAYKRLYDKGVSLVFLKEPYLNTDEFKAVQQVAMTDTDIDCVLKGINEYLLKLAERQIQIAFESAQAEVDYLHKRISEGMAQAKLADKRIGTEKGRKLTTKKSIDAKEKIRQYSRDFGGSLTDTDCIKLIGVTRNTYYKYKKEMLLDAETDNK